MKTKKADNFESKTGYLTYTVNNNEFWVQGEFYYNSKKSRHEHRHTGLRGGITLIIF